MMRLFLMAFAVLLLCPAAHAGESVTFTWRPLTGGQTITQSEDLRMDFGIDVFVGEAKLGAMSAENVESESMTAVLGKWTAKKKVAAISYGRSGSRESQTTPDGKTEVSDDPSPVSGKSFDVTWSAGGEPQIRYAAGGEPPEAERSVVLEDWASLTATEPSDFEAALAGKSVAVGAPLTSDGEVMARLLSLDDDELSVRDATMTLREITRHGGQRCGVFDLELTIVGADAEMNMTMTAKGEAIVGVDGLQPHAVTLAGPVALSATVQEGELTLNMSGGGAFAFGMAYTYGK